MEPEHQIKPSIGGRLWVLIPLALIGPLIIGILVQLLFGGGLRETDAYTAGIMLIYPVALMALVAVLSLNARPGGPRMIVFLVSAAASAFWWLVMVVGSIAP